MVYIPRDERFQEGGEFVKDRSLTNLKNHLETQKRFLKLAMEDLRNLQEQQANLYVDFRNGRISQRDYDFQKKTLAMLVKEQQEFIKEIENEDIKRLENMIAHRIAWHKEGQKLTGHEQEDIAEYMGKIYARKQKNKSFMDRVQKISGVKIRKK